MNKQINLSRSEVTKLVAYGLIVFGLLIILSTSAYATEFENVVGDTFLTNDATCTTYDGVWFDNDVTSYIVNITRLVGNNYTSVVILDENRSVVGVSYNLTGETFDFPAEEIPLYAGMNYSLVVNCSENDASHFRLIWNEAGYPLSTDSVTWRGRVDGGNYLTDAYVHNFGAMVTSNDSTPPPSTPEITFVVPANNTIQFYLNDQLNFSTTVEIMDGTVITLQNIYYENGDLYQTINTTSANVSNTFTINDTGIYYLNATATNGTDTLATETRLFTLYDLTSGSISVPASNENVTRFLNVTWSNSSSTNDTVALSNYSLRLLNYDNSLNQTLDVTTSNNFYWNTYYYNLSVGLYKFVVMTTDVNDNTVNSSSTTFNITKNAFLNVTAYDITTNETLNNMSVNITDINSGLTEFWNDAGSNLLIDIIKNRNYSLFFDVQNYAYEIVNISSNSSALQILNQSLTKTNSLNINVYDEGSLALITNVTGGGLMNITFVSDTGSLSYNTTTGTLFVSNITADYYEVKIVTPLYSQRSYFVNVTNRSTQTLNAYLSQSTINLLLTYVNKETGELLENVGINVYKIVNSSWTAVATGFTDITGRWQVSVSTNTNYRFSSTFAGYDDKTFNLNPVIFTSYTVQLTKQVSSGDLLDFSNINVYTYNTSFSNNGTNIFGWQISAPTGNLESYAYSLNTECKNISTYSGVNAFGGMDEITFNLSCASVMDAVTLKYNYTLSGGELREFTYTYSIAGISDPPAFTSNQDEQYGMGMFERILISVLITIIMAGLIARFSNIVAGLGAGLFIISYLSYIGFIEWWLIAPTLLVGFILITSWSSKGG